MLSEGGPQGGGAAEGRGHGKASLAALSCRRNAWRLATCAEALVGPDGGSGLARLLGNDATAAKDLAAKLKQAATGLDLQPDERSVLDALAALGKPATGASTTPEESRPEKPRDDEPASPFESPFK
jgi:hypothetical protein